MAKNEDAENSSSSLEYLLILPSGTDVEADVAIPSSLRSYALRCCKVKRSMCAFVLLSLFAVAMVIIFYDHKVGGHENQAKSHNSRCPQVFTTSTTRDTFDLKAALLKHRNLSVFDLTFPGTHNSAINLSPKLEDMPRGTEYSTTHPSVAIKPFPYTVLNQRLSVYDQLEHGIRYLMFETVEIPLENKCPRTLDFTEASPCICKYELDYDCFKCCDLLVTHGTFVESYHLDLGYSFLEDLFMEIKLWVECGNTDQLVWIHLDAYNLNCHNDHKKYRKTITSILKSSGLYNYVYNPPTILNDIETQTRKTFLVSDMLITSKKNIILSSTCEDKNNIQMVSSYFVSGGFPGEQTCYKPLGAKCHVGWDSSSGDDMALSKIAIKDKVGKMSAFVMYHMTSSRKSSSKPYLHGGNPWEASSIRNKTLMLEKMIKYNDEFKQHVNIVLVDFFNTTVEEKGEPGNMKLVQAPLGPNNVVAAACEYTTRTIHRYNIFRGKSALTAAPGAHSDIRKDAKGLANALLGCRHGTLAT